MKLYAVAWKHEDGWSWRLLEFEFSDGALAMAVFRGRTEAETVAKRARSCLDYRVHEFEFPELSEDGALLVSGPLGDAWAPLREEDITQ